MSPAATLYFIEKLAKSFEERAERAPTLPYPNLPYPTWAVPQRFSGGRRPNSIFPGEVLIPFANRRVVWVPVGADFAGK